MSNFFDLLIPYILRVLPGMILGIAAIFFFRKSKDIRIFICVLLFILFRDTMTPLQLWFFGSEGIFWIRVIENQPFLLFFGCFCIFAMIVLYFADKPNKKLFVWKIGSTWRVLLFGVLGALVVAAPFMTIYRFIPIELRGGAVPFELIPVILFFTLSENLMEEGIFRRYIAGRLREFSCRPNQPFCELSFNIVVSVHRFFALNTAKSRRIHLIRLDFYCAL